MEFELLTPDSSSKIESSQLMARDSRPQKSSSVKILVGFLFPVERYEVSTWGV
jgi:hypothetical protein